MYKILALAISLLNVQYNHAVCVETVADPGHFFGYMQGTKRAKMAMGLANSKLM